MDSRFTLKDFVFLTLFVVVIAAIVFVGWMFHYQELRLNDVKDTLAQLKDVQKEQLTTLGRIDNALRNGVHLTTGPESTTEASTQNGGGGGRIRRTEADGSQYVYYPDVPDSPRYPDRQPDYAIGDWLVQNVGMEPAVIAPFIEKDMAGQLAHVPVLESLIGQDPQSMEWFPYIADWYRISPDGLKFTFHIRSQACFSDGVPVTPEDVVFSFNTVKNPDVDCAPLRSYYDKVQACKKVDDHTVEFTMSEPYFLALEFIGSLSIIPEHVYKYAKGDDFNKDGAKLVGTGPYKVEKWDRGQRLTFVRNDKYWGDRPSFDKIIFLFIGDSQAQLQSFLKGELDYLGEPIEPDPEIYLKYSADPAFLKSHIAYKYATPVAMSMYLGWNCDHPMFHDKETRQALTMLIDRKQIISQMLHGFGEEMTGPFIHASKQNDPSIQPLPYDPAAAKAKLAAAGWKPGSDGVLERDGVKFEFDMCLRTGVPLRERIATYVQQQFKQAGIRMRLTPYESSVLIDKLDKRDFDACLAGWGGAGVESDPKQIWDSSSIENQGSNHVAFRNKDSDALIAQGERTMDEPKRMEIWHQFERLVYDEQPYTWLYSEVDCAFIDGRFKNTQPYPLGLSPLDWYVPLKVQRYK